VFEWHGQITANSGYAFGCCTCPCENDISKYYPDNVLSENDGNIDVFYSIVVRISFLYLLLRLWRFCRLKLSIVTWQWKLGTCKPFGQRFLASLVKLCGSGGILNWPAINILICRTLTGFYGLDLTSIRILLAWGCNYVAWHQWGCGVIVLTWTSLRFRKCWKHQTARSRSGRMSLATGVLLRLPNSNNIWQLDGFRWRLGIDKLNLVVKDVILIFFTYLMIFARTTFFMFWHCQAPRQEGA